MTSRKEYEEGYNPWYESEHIAQLLAIPGFLSPGRYAAIKGGPRYLTLYELENAAVSESDAWERARDSNPWGRRVRPFTRHDENSPGIYRRIDPQSGISDAGRRGK